MKPDDTGGERSRLPRDYLSPERIVAAALTLIDEGGESALSFRRLGAELGASPTSVYRHFRDKDELLLAMANRLLDDALVEGHESPDWRATLRAVAEDMHRAYLRHPRLAILVAGRTAVGVSELRIAEVILRALGRAGVPTEEQPMYYRAFEDTVLAWSCFDATYVTTAPEARQRDERAWLTRYGTASPAEYPSIAAARPHVVPLTDRQVFAVAVTLLIEAIEQRFGKATPTRH